MQIGVYEAMVKGSKVVKAFRRFCVQLIGSEGMLEHGLGHSEPRHSCPDHFILYTRSAMGAHNHELIGVLDQGTR
jgi:hypothetical protein